MVIAQDHVLHQSGEVLPDGDRVVDGTLSGGVGVEILDAPALCAEDFEELIAA